MTSAVWSAERDAVRAWEQTRKRRRAQSEGCGRSETTRKPVEPDGHLSQNDYGTFTFFLDKFLPFPGSSFSSNLPSRVRRVYELIEKSFSTVVLHGVALVRVAQTKILALLLNNLRALRAKLITQKLHRGIGSLSPSLLQKYLEICLWCLQNQSVDEKFC